MEYIIGVDIGTTSTKSILFDMDGKVVKTSNSGYPLYQTEVDMAEQDPEEIFSAVIETISEVAKEVGKKSIKGVSFSAAMHSLIVLDKDMNPITRSITWADNRAAKQSEQLKQNDGREIYLKTGTPIHPMSPLCKIMWLREDQPTIFSKANYFIGIKEYVLYKLFGQLKMDYSIASATGLLNLFTLDWDDQALEAAGISKDMLPELVDSTYQLKNLRTNYAEELGLLSDTPFIIGASDGVLSNLGVGAIDPGEVALTIGTSGAIRTVVDKPSIDPKERLFCYALTKDFWVVGGAVNNGGIVLSWVKEKIYGTKNDNSYEALLENAERISTGSEGLLFLPYLAGERAPLWNADARGTYFGLTHRHGQDHMLRAALEGICFNLYEVFSALEEVTGSSRIIKATGGFSRSPFWRQMISDVFGREVTIPQSFESSCLGAAILGMYSLGKVETLSIAADMIGTTYSHMPDQEANEIYQELTGIFNRLSQVVLPEFTEIAKFQRKH